MYFITEDPPLKKKGFGLSVLMYNILTSLDETKNTVFTFKDFGNTINLQDLTEDSHWDVVLLDRAQSIVDTLPVLGRFRSFSILFNFILSLPVLRKKLKENSSAPVLISVGASARPIIYSFILNYFVKNPISLYIVDDFERINEINNNKFEKFVSKLLVKKVIKSANKLFVISEGLKQKYYQSYGVNSRVLLPCFNKVNLTHLNSSLNTANEHKCTFVFSGGLSILYNDTLKLFAEQLQSLKKKDNKDYKLIIQTYSSKKQFDSINFPVEVVEYRTSPERSSDLPSFREATCFIVPYSFDQKNKDLVRTSFPQKVAELIQLKKPILFVGPGYSSVIKFFKEYSVQYVVSENNIDCLAQVIAQIATSGADKGTLEAYASIYNNNFSTLNVKRVLNER